MAIKNDKKGFKPNIYWMYALIFGALIFFYYTQDNSASSSREVSWTEFEQYVRLGSKDTVGIEKIVVNTKKNEIEGYLSDYLAVKTIPGFKPSKNHKARIIANIPSADKVEDKVEEWKEDGVFTGNVEYESSSSDFMTLLWSFGPIILLIFFWFWIMRRMGSGGRGGGGVFNVGKSRAKVYDKKDKNAKNVTFDDVAGLDKEKQELSEIVDYLKNPDRYTDLGGNIPKGVLLVGPPGTGKTLLARAVAGEANVPFMSMSGSDFVEMFVGVGASRVRDTFKQAKEKAPCIIFIDEIDAIGRARSRKFDYGSNDERENTLNQLLTEMDGFGANSGVIVMGATNRADVLDKALLRAGRFNRQVYIGNPSTKDREAIFRVHLKKIKIDGSVDIADLAERTSGMSGADIADICNEAALLAARHKKKAAQQQEFIEAIDKVDRILDKPTRMDKPVTFDDVAGMHRPKNALGEVIEFLKSPDKFTRLGGKIPRGVLLVGPSGSGKTLLAKAVAGEAHVPFFSASAAEFQGEFMGSGVSRVRELFSDAKQKAPCIIFIDELDAIGDRATRGNSEREITLNQLLAEMDGYSTNEGVIVLAATNRMDAVDKALLRPGRFDRKVYVGFPAEDDRLEIFNLYLNKITLADDVDAKELAKITSGFSGVEISKTVNEAALAAASAGKDAVTQEDLKAAVEVTRKGLENKQSVIGTVTFADVAGMDDAKQEVTEIVDFLKNPGKYNKLGGKVPRGALLVGPPGTGKTMLARAVAGEANVPFFSASGSEFDEVYVGVGASRVRQLFEEAKEKAPSVIFIDEIDAVGAARGQEFAAGRDQTLNQLLTEMDGFDGNTGVIVLAATNRAELLDQALLRPGRFDRQIQVNLPPAIDREAIFRVHLKKIKLDDSVDISLLAKQTAGFSGADIANMCNEAAIFAARANRETVIQQDFNDAYDKVTMGLENKSLILTQRDKFETAVHEAGHATVSWHIEHSEPLVKISIVPRGQALGVNLHVNEEHVHLTKQAFLDRICTFMGGRAAEEIFLGTIGSGALNDMQQATRIARAMVMYYGMSDKLPNISYYDPQRVMGQRPYSEAQAEVIDQEVQAIVSEQYARAKKLVQENAKGHKAIVDELLDKEVIYAADVERIFGPRPWKYRSDELNRIYEERRAKREEESKREAGESQDDSTDANNDNTEETPPPFTRNNEEE